MATRNQHTEVIARGLVLVGSNALACQNVKHGYLYLPGGHVEFGESAPRSLERELMEEAGIIVVAGGLALVTEDAFDDAKQHHHELNLVFHVKHSLGSASNDRVTPPQVPSREPKIGFVWIPIAEAESMDIRPLSIRAWLARIDPKSLPAMTWRSGIAAKAG